MSCSARAQSAPACGPYAVNAVADWQLEWPWGSRTSGSSRCSTMCDWNTLLKCGWAEAPPSMASPNAFSSTIGSTIARRYGRPRELRGARNNDN